VKNDFRYVWNKVEDYLICDYLVLDRWKVVCKRKIKGIKGLDCNARCC